jgi:drug/metabolite transporter (DMT)-like permease
MSPTPIQRGVTLAALAAVLFGLTVPLLKRASAGLGALTSASLLYLGAALGAAVALALRGRAAGVLTLARRVPGRIAAVAVLGAIVAPALLVLGLARTDAATGSLLLTLELPFTLLLARAFTRERFGRRALEAAALMLTGSVLLAGRLPAGAGGLAGAALVAAASLAWALDNVLSRPLAELDPLAVVALKGGLGGGLSAALALVSSSERAPAPGAALAVLAVGAVGYGLSLRLYLGAQALIGAGRTTSVFGAAPFVGALAALLFGAAWPGWTFVAAAALLLAGVALHATERHRHPHTHEAVVHEHLHEHDDAHHAHSHDPPFAGPGPHCHVHRHEGVTHDHEHSDDLHHRHPH